VGIGVVCDVEPVTGPAFAVVGGGEEFVDEFFVGERVGVLDEEIDAVGVWGEAVEIEGETPDEGAAVGDWGGGEVLMGEGFLDERVDGGVVWEGGWDGLNGPVVEGLVGFLALGVGFGPMGTGGDPVLEDFDGGGRKSVSLWGHT
jgi:hypothetical protein